MDRLYEKEKEKVAIKLLRLEKGNVFKSEVDQWETRVTELKKHYNMILYRIEKGDKKFKDLDFIHAAFGGEHNLNKEFKEMDRVKDLNDENEILLTNEIVIQEGLIHKEDANKSDILILKEKIEKLKQVLRNKNIMLQELDYKKNGYRIRNDKMASDMHRLNENKAKRNPNTDVSVDSLFAQNIQDEMSLYEDRIILDEIKDHEARLEKEKQDELELKKQAMDIKKQKAMEDEIKRKKKATQHLKTELEKKKQDLSKIMKKMKVSQPEMVLTKVSEMTGVKEGLKDLIVNYQNEIQTLKDEVSDLQEQKRLQTIDDGENEMGIEKNVMEQIELAQKNGDDASANT